VQEQPQIPKFVSIVAIVLGCLDLVRGFMHTIVLELAATSIAGLDLSGPAGADLVVLMGSFGISNYITGTMLILLGWKSRPLALAMLAVIPLSYAIGAISVRAHAVAHTASQANWGGAPMMAGYMVVCVVTFVTGIWISSSGARA